MIWSETRQKQLPPHVARGAVAFSPVEIVTDRAKGVSVGWIGSTLSGRAYGEPWLS